MWTKKNIIILVCVLAAAAVIFLCVGMNSGKDVEPAVSESPAPAESAAPSPDSDVVLPDDSELEIVKPKPLKPKPSATPKPTESSAPTQSPDPSESPAPSESPKPSESPDPSASPVPTGSPEPSTEPQSGSYELAEEYVNYASMSGEEQFAYFQTFGDPESFLNWYNSAKAAYDEYNEVIVINPGDVIDLTEDK